MEKKKVYKIIPVEFVESSDGAYVLNSPDGEQYKLTGGNFPTTRGSLIRLDGNTFLRLMNDITVEANLEEIVILNEEEYSDIQPNIDLNLSNIKDKDPAVWPEEPTKILIQMYKKFKPLVDKAEIKTMKQMFEKINNILKEHGYNYEINQVESKWKGLVRSYKTKLQHGSRRKRPCSSEPFEKELAEILSSSGYILKKDVESNNSCGPSGQNNTEEMSTKGTTINFNTEGINYNLFRIAKAIETETSKRSRTEEIKMEQRERLISAIERGNELLVKLLERE